MNKVSILAALIAAIGMVSTASAQLVGSADNRESTCTKIANAFAGDDCSYSNSAMATFGGWTGPGSTGGYFDRGSAGDDPDFTPGAGDGSINPTVTIDLTVDGSNSVSGTITYGEAARNVGTGQGTRAVESWSSIVHTVTPKVADSVIGGNIFGGSDYIIGSAGIPGALCLTSDSSQCYIVDETPEDTRTGATTTIGAYNGGTAPTVGVEGITNLTFNGTANVGTTTTAVLNDGACADQNGEDCIAGEDGSAILWSANENPGWDNLIMVVSTNAAGDVVAVEGWWTETYRIDFGAPDPDPTGDNSLQGGHFTAAIPIPAVAWMFPAGLVAGLGWMRRRRNKV